MLSKGWAMLSKLKKMPMRTIFRVMSPFTGMSHVNPTMAIILGTPAQRIYGLNFPIAVFVLSTSILMNGVFITPITFVMINSHMRSLGLSP